MQGFLKEHRETFMVIILAGIFSAALICRAFYGMDTTDETFYLATAKRFWDGDILFRDDWNTGQVFGLLLEPFYRMYCWIRGNNEGIILFSRILFVLLELLVFGCLYRELRYYKAGFGAAVFSAAAIFLYARGNIITISYYNLSFLMFLLAILCWMRGEHSNRKEAYLFLAGIFFSVSVLCMPYMAVLAVLLGFAGMYWYLNKEKGKSRMVVWFFLGVVFSAAVFLMYFFRIIPWENLMETLPNMFQDPGMEKEGIFTQLKGIGIYIATAFLKYTWLFYLATFFISVLLGKGYVKQSAVRKYFPGILMAEFLIQSVYVRGYFEGGVALTFFLLVLQIQLANPELRIKSLEKFFVIPGILFGMAWIMGSNVGERVVNMSFLLMDIWAVSYLWKYTRSYRGIRQAFFYVPALLLLMVLGVIRFCDIYRDGAIPDLTYQISSGVMKGIYTEPSRGLAYENTVQLLKRETDSENRIVVWGCNPWGYLDTEASCGAYTTWQLGDGEALLEKYYKMFPEKIPDTILLVSPEANTYEHWKYSSHGVGVHKEEEGELPGILLKLVEEEGYRRIEEHGSVLYQK